MPASLKCMNDVLQQSGFDTSNADLIDYFLDHVFYYNANEKPLPLEFNWTPLVRKQLESTTFANTYEEAIVLKCFFDAFPWMCACVRPLLALLEITKEEVCKWFERAADRSQIVYLYEHILKFVLTFMLCMTQRKRVDFGKELTFAPAKLTGYENVDKFYADTQDAADQIGNITALSMNTTFSSIAAIMNGIAPLMANLAYFNPDGTNQKKKTMDALNKDRAMFDQMVRDGKLKGLALTFARLLPESSNTYTKHEHDYLVQKQEQEMMTPAEREAIAKSAKDTTMHGMDIWLLKNEDRIHKLESKQEAFVRKVFPFGAKHEKAFTIIWRIIMAMDYMAPQTWIPGVLSVGVLPMQYALRQFSRPELYIVLSRILNHLPEHAPMSVYVNRVFDLLNKSNKVLKPLLPLINAILGYTYPVWTKAYKQIMSFINMSSRLVFQRLFPSQRTVTVTARQFEEGIGALIQLAGLAWRTYEMFGFFELFWAYKIAKYVIVKYGPKIATMVIAAV